MLIPSTSSFTSAAVEARNKSITDVYVSITAAGACAVALEQQGEDGVWRSFPSTRWIAEGAYVVSVKRGFWRIVITAGPCIVGAAM